MSLWRALAGLAAAGLLAACLVSPPRPEPTRTPPARLYPLPAPLASPEYGMHVFLWWHADNKTGSNDVGLVQDMGFGWVKQKFPWREIELAPGVFNWWRADLVVDLVESRDLRLLARLDVQPLWAQADPAASQPNGPPQDVATFGRFCGAIAERYRGRIQAYEVWNEPNLTREWGGQPADPAGYVALLKTCYLAIKAADPQALVVSAGLAPTDDARPEVAMPDVQFYQGMYAAGGAPYFDLLGVHAPGYGNPPERSPEETLADPFWQGRVWTFRHVEDVRALMVANGDGDKQIAITEMGWTTDQVNPGYAWYAVTEEQQAEYLVRAYRYAREHWSPWISLMVTIYIADPDWTPEQEQYWWSITRPVPPGDPPQVLPAYDALKSMEKLVKPNDR